MLRKLEREALEVVVSQHEETRRGAQGRVLRMVLSANAPERRKRLDAAMQTLVKKGLVISGPNGWVPTEDARPALDAADDDSEATATIRNSRTVAGDGTGEALPDAVEYPATVERVGEPVSPELLERCAVLVNRELAQATTRWNAGDHTVLDELAWLRETARQLVQVGTGHD